MVDLYEGGANGTRRLSLPLIRVNPRSVVHLAWAGTVPICVGTHWFGKSLICIGDGCPACEVMRVRLSVFALARIVDAGVLSPLAMLECSAASWCRYEGLATMDTDGVAPGQVVAVTRRAANKPLVIEPMPGQVVPMEKPGSLHQLLQAVSVLLRVPGPLEGEGAVAWRDRMKPTFRLALESALRS